MWKPISSVFLRAQEPGLGLTGGVLEAWSPERQEPEGRGACLMTEVTRVLLALKHP